MQEHDIDQWLKGLAEKTSNTIPADTREETDILKSILHEEQIQQQTTYQKEAKQDWPDLLARLHKEYLLEETETSVNIFKTIITWLSVPFFRNWKFAIPAGGAVIALTVVAVVFLFSQQPTLKPLMSDNYTLYPHYRGGSDTVLKIQNNKPDRYTARIIKDMDRCNIPYKLDRLKNGYQIEYFLPDTLPATATNFIKKWPFPREYQTWHFIHIVQK